MSDDVNKKTIFNLRVLDEDAMREQAEKLKSLIDEAASSSRELDGLIESGRKVNTGAASAKEELQGRLQLGGHRRDSLSVPWRVLKRRQRVDAQDLYNPVAIGILGAVFSNVHPY